jgi:hypothetical protein
LAALRHGIAGVQRHIQQGVRHLVAIDGNDRGHRIQARHNVDPLAKRALQQPQRIQHQLIDCRRLGS